MREKHKPLHLCLLAAIIITAVTLLTVCIYLAMNNSLPSRGSAGVLQQNSPGRDPPPPVMH